MSNKPKSTAIPYGDVFTMDGVSLWSWDVFNAVSTHDADGITTFVLWTKSYNGWKKNFQCMASLRKNPMVRWSPLWICCGYNGVVWTTKLVALGFQEFGKCWKWIKMVCCSEIGHPMITGWNGMERDGSRDVLKPWWKNHPLMEKSPLLTWKFWDVPLEKIERYWSRTEIFVFFTNNAFV